MTLTESITAVQAAKKQLTGGDADVATETADVAAEQAILAQKQATLQAAQDADAGFKSVYKSSLTDLAAAVATEIATLP